MNFNVNSSFYLIVLYYSLPPPEADCTLVFSYMFSYMGKGVLFVTPPLLAIAFANTNRLVYPAMTHTFIHIFADSQTLT